LRPLSWPRQSCNLIDEKNHSLERQSRHDRFDAFFEPVADVWLSLTPIQGSRACRSNSGTLPFEISAPALGDGRFADARPDQHDYSFFGKALESRA
jgi:hypothetical protein